MYKTKRITCTVYFNLNVIQYAKEHGNKATKRHCGHLPTEKMICEWREQKARLQQLGKNKHSFHIHIAKWPQLEGVKNSYHITETMEFPCLICCH
jgi:hypothetical protein